MATDILPEVNLTDKQLEMLSSTIYYGLHYFGKNRPQVFPSTSIQIIRIIGNLIKSIQGKHYSKIQSITDIDHVLETAHAFLISQKDELEKNKIDVEEIIGEIAPVLGNIKQIRGGLS